MLLHFLRVRIRQGHAQSDDIKHQSTPRHNTLGSHLGGQQRIEARILIRLEDKVKELWSHRRRRVRSELLADPQKKRKGQGGDHLEIFGLAAIAERFDGFYGRNESYVHLLRVLRREEGDDIIEIARPLVWKVTEDDRSEHVCELNAEGPGCSRYQELKKSGFEGCTVGWGDWRLVGLWAIGPNNISSLDTIFEPNGTRLTNGSENGGK